MDRDYLSRLLDRVSGGDSDARTELLALIAKEPPGIQALAYEALETGGEDTYDQLLLTLADDPTLYIRSPKKPKPLDLFSTAMPETPVAGIPSLGSRSKEIPGTLLTGIRNDNRTARASALRALGEYGEAAIPYLLEALHSHDRLVMGAAADGLSAVGKAAEGSVIPLTSDPDEQVRWHAYKVLSTVATDAAAPTLIKGLDSSNSGVRWLAAEGLVHIGRGALRPLFQQLTNEKISQWLRNGAIHVLNKVSWSNDQDRYYYTSLAKELKNAPTATISHIARRELEKL